MERRSRKPFNRVGIHVLKLNFMNSKKIVLSFGAFILAIGGVIAGRATAKFGSPVSALYYKNAANQCLTLASSISTLKLTTGSGTSNAQIRTVGGVAKQIFATTGCQQAVYFHP
jgi:hypothetical protein